MILLDASERRGHLQDFWLGGSTAAVAGFVNVCSVIAFFAFASNVTGHVAILAEELVKGHVHQIRVVLVWLLLFVLGSFLANLSVTTLAARSPRWGRAIPLLLEIAALSGVAYYGHLHYAETLLETEYLVGVLLLTMGLQNGMVATASNGVVKTTHLTGLATDLGMELSMMLQRRFRRDRGVRFKLTLHVVILGAYVVGGVLGGVLFLDFGFLAFGVAGAGLGAILVHDVIVGRLAASDRAETSGLRAQPR